MDATWIERDGRRVWSESWEAKRGVPFTPAEVESLRAQAKQHLDDATRDGKIPAMAWVLVERLLAAFASSFTSAYVRGLDAARKECDRIDRESQDSMGYQAQDCSAAIARLMEGKA